METQDHKPVSLEQNSLMAILAYIGPLVIVSYLVDNKDPFVKFHIKQGLVLLCIEIIIWLITPMFFWQLWSLLQLINFLVLVLAIVGIINVTQKKEKMLPVVGTLSSYFKF